MKKTEGLIMDISGVSLAYRYAEAGVLRVIGANESSTGDTEGRKRALVEHQELEEGVHA